MVIDHDTIELTISTGAKVFQTPFISLRDRSFRNSPIGGNSPISCGGKRHTYPEHFPQSQICHQSFLFPWAMELGEGGGGGRLKKRALFSIRCVPLLCYPVCA